MDTGGDRLDWHAAFREALKLEFDDYLDVLDFEFEHQLNTKPLQIDAVIIKKRAEVQIAKSIGRIFKGTNIVEYVRHEVAQLADQDIHKRKEVKQGTIFRSTPFIWGNATCRCVSGNGRVPSGGDKAVNGDPYNR
jgi:hypothetical protein